ncbi:MAG: methylmalonyl-CoA mutase family protein, partial [Planctomycetota bacterium]
SLPSAKAAQVALRSQQILARESGVTEVVDPLGGCPYVEDLTARIATQARALIEEIDAQGGTVATVESGFMRRRIQASAYRAQKAIESGERAPVGVKPGGEIPPAPFHVDPAGEKARREQLARFRKERHEATVRQRLHELDQVAHQGGNVLPALIEAVDGGATLGEVSRTLADRFGEFRDGR